jgi:hypothetical protein
MSEKKDVFKKMFKFAGVYHWKRFVSVIKDWGTERGFDVYELGYVEKVPEIEMMILGERKRDEYLADYFQIEIHLWAVRDVPGQKGFIESRGEYLVKGWVETGYKDIYGERPLREGWLGKFDDLFKKHIIAQHLDVKHYDVFYYEVLNLSRTMQQAVGMDMALTRQEEEN